MKLILVLLILFVAFPVYAESPGSVVFFYVEQKGNIDTEVSNDFYHYYNKVKSSFVRNGFEVLLVEQEPIKIKKSNYNISLSIKDIGIELGVLFIKPTGEYQIHKGISTGIDLLLSAEKYFEKKILGE